MLDAIAGESVIEATPTNEDDILLTTREVADRHRLDPATLANLRTRGEGLPYIKLDSGAVRYKLADVLRSEALGSHGFTWQRVWNALEAYPGLTPAEALKLFAHLKAALKD